MGSSLPWALVPLSWALYHSEALKVVLKRCVGRSPEQVG